MRFISKFYPNKIGKNVNGFEWTEDLFGQLKEKIKDKIKNNNDNFIIFNIPKNNSFDISQGIPIDKICAKIIYFNEDDMTIEAEVLSSFPDGKSLVNFITNEAELATSSVVIYDYTNKKIQDIFVFLVGLNEDYNKKEDNNV